MNARSTAGGIASRPTGWDGFSQSSRASLVDPRLEPSGQKTLATAFARSFERMALADSPLNLCMQRPNRALIDLRGFFATPLKDVGCAVQQCPSPLGSNQWRTMARSTDRSLLDAPHIRQPIRAPSAHPSKPQSQQGLKASDMVPAFLHGLISTFLETNKAQIVACITVQFSGVAQWRLRGSA